MNQFQNSSQKLQALKDEKLRLEAAISHATKTLKIRQSLPNPTDAQKLDITKAQDFLKFANARMITVVSSIDVISDGLKMIGEHAKGSSTASGKRIRH
jgi:hypothetical protein